MKKEDIETKELIELIDTIITELPILYPIVMEVLNQSQSDLEFIARFGFELSKIRKEISITIEYLVLLSSLTVGIDYKPNDIENMLKQLINSINKKTNDKYAPVDR